MSYPNGWLYEMIPPSAWTRSTSCLYKVSWTAGNVL